MPLYQITGPDGKIYQIEGPEGATREQVIQAIQMRMAQQEIAPTPEEEQGLLGMTGSAIMRGAKQTGSLLADVLPAQIATAVGADEYAARQMAEAAETQREIQEKYPARYPTLESVEGVGDYIPFTLETIAEQIPNIATALVPGVGGASLAGRAALGAATARGATTAAAQAAAKSAAIKGAGVGSFLGSYALNSPEIFQNIYEETGELAPGAAALAGSVAAALDAILPGVLASRLTGNTKATVVEKILERSGMQPGVARGAAAGVIGGAATEGPTEAAQEAISIAAEKFVADNDAVWSSKEFNRLVESGVRGAVGGGGISGTIGAVQGIGERVPEQAPEIQDPAMREMQARLREEQVAVDRYTQLKTKAEGTPERTVLDDNGKEVVIPAVQPEFLTLDERQEYQDLRQRFSPEQEVADVGAERGLGDVAVDTGRGEPGVESVVGTAPRITEGVEAPGVSTLGGVEDIPGRVERREEPVGPALAPVEVEDKNITSLYDAEESMPKTEGVEAVQESWVGGVSGLGERGGAYDLFRIEGGPEYTNQLRDLVRKNLGESFVGYRLMHKDEAEALLAGDVGDISSFSTSPKTALSFANIAAYRNTPKEDLVLFKMPLTPEHVLMLGNRGERELVVDTGVGFDMQQVSATPYPEAVTPETPTVTPAEPTLEAPQAEIPGLEAAPAAPVEFSLRNLLPQEDKKLISAYDELTNPRAKKLPEARTELSNVNTKASELVGFIQQRGFDPSNITADAPQEVKDAGILLRNLGASAKNIANAQRNDVDAYNRAKDKKAFNAQPKTGIDRQVNAARETIKAVDNFLANPSVGTGQDIVFSRQAKPGGRGMKAGAVQNQVSEVRDAFANAPMARVVQNVSELPSDIQAQIAEEGVIPKGLYNTKTAEIFLVADYLSGPTDVFMTLAHETVGHFGIRAILGENYSRAMGEIYAGNADIRNEVDARMESNPKLDRDIAVEELLAERAEREVTKADAGKKFSITGALKQLINYIRRFARSIGVPLRDVTDIEIAELIANARRFVERGEIGFDRFTEGVAADRPLAAKTAAELEEGRRAGALPAEVILQNAAWSPERIDSIISENAYYGRDSDRKDTKAWVAFVNPKDFVEATTTETYRDVIEKEKTPLDRERLAKYDMPMHLTLEPKTVDIEDGFAIIASHEGRHRMAALRDAGITKVPIVLYNGYGGSRVTNAQSTGVMVLMGQDFGEDGPRTTKDIVVSNVIAVTADNAKYIRREFGSPSASVVFSPAEKRVDAVFSQFTPSAGPNRVNPQNVNSVTEDAAKQRLRYDQARGMFGINTLKSLAPAARNLMMKVMTLRMINDSAGTKAPQIGQAIRIVENMVSMRNNIMKEAQEKVIADTLKVLKTKNGSDQIQLMGELAIQSTMLGVDPDPQGKFHGPNQTLTDAWNMLTPEVQKIYKNMRDFYEEQVNGMYQDQITRIRENFKDDLATAGRLIRELNDQFGPAMNQGPYFPLRRFGQYWFQVGKGADKEFYMFESAFDRDFWMKERQQELINEGKTAEEASNMFNVGNSLGGDTDSLHGALATESLFKKFDEIIDKSTKGTTPDQVKAEIKDSIRQLNYLLLPTANMKKMFIHRKNIPGASTDITRVFSSSAVNIAYQRARNKYAEPYYTNLENAKAMLEGNNTEEGIALKDVVNELESRTPHILGIEPTTGMQNVANNLTQFSFLWLLTAPSSALLNTIGMVAVGMPYIAARYGYGPTMGKLLDYAKKYVGTAPKFREGTTAAPTLEKLKDTEALTDVQKRAYDRFLHDNLVDASLTFDVMGLADRPLEKRGLLTNRLVEGLTFLFHHSERMNREIMSMSIFDFAYDKFKKQGLNEERAFENAIQEAKDLTTMSLGDFTRAGRAPIFTGPVAKVIFQFKQYSLLMTYNLLRNTYLGFNPFRKDLSPDDKAMAKEARRRMYGVLGMTALFAGAKGMPIFGATAAMVEGLSALGDDEDEIVDFEYWLDGYLRDTFGGTAAAAIMRGAIPQLTGASLSERAGLDIMDLWLRDANYQKTAEDTIKEQILAMLGPTVSIGLTGAKGWDSMQNGQFERGLESMMPAVARNLVVTKRFFEEGEATTRRGVQIAEDITAGEMLSQTLGFTPERIMAKQKAIIKRKQEETKINAKKERLLNALYFGWLYNDEDLYDASLDKLIDLKEKYPEITFDGDTVIKSIRSRFENKMLQEAFGGVDRKFGPRMDEIIRVPD